MPTKFYARGVPGTHWEAQPWSPVYKSSAIPADGTLMSSNPQGVFGRLVDTPAEALAGMYIGIANTNWNHNGGASVYSYVGTFFSDPLASQTISAGTWTAGMGGIYQSSNAANSFFVCSVFVWRPSTDTIVGYVWDSTTPIGAEASTSLTMRTGTFAGAAVSCQAGDVLVWEIWFTMRATMSGNYGYSVTTAGTEEVANGTALNTTTTTGASWLVAPANISLDSYTETRWHMRTTAPARGGPGETFHSTAYPRAGRTLYDTSYSTGSLLTTGGVSQSSATWNAPADNTYDVHAYTFVSPTLEAVTVPKTLWTFLPIKVSDDNRFFQPVFVMYVWRPGTNARVATIMDTTTPSVYPGAEYEWAEFDNAGTFTGRQSVVHSYVVDSFSIAEGDQIVVEMWEPNGYRASSTNHPYIYFNGSTDRTEWGASRTTLSTTQAAILQIPRVTLTEYTGGIPYEKTVVADAVLEVQGSTTETRTVGADAVLSVTGAHTVDADARLQQTQAATMAASAVIGAVGVGRTFHFPQIIG